MSETVCPFCGHSPVPDRAEYCPSCEREFSKDNVDETGVTRTRLGGLTGAVTANPTPTAVAMFVGAAWWLLRGTGWLGFEEPWWTLLFSAAHVVAAVMVLSNLGPATHVPSLVAASGAVAGLVLSPGHPVHTGAAVVYAVVVLAQTAGDPGPLRLWVGAALATAAVAVGVGSLFVGQAQTSQTLSTPTLTLTLPAGWKVSRAEAAAPLKVPVATARRSVWIIERASPKAFGVAVVPTGAAAGADSRCGELLELLELPAARARAGLVPPPVFGAEATFVDVVLSGEVPVRVACGERPAGALLLLVGSRDEETPQAAAAFEAVAGGLSAR